MSSDYLLAVLLGVVEGITEFLPISSTAHIRLVQMFLGISLESEFWKLFAVFIQLGAILAVMIIYRARLVGFLRSLPLGSGLVRHPAGLIGIAFVTTAVPAFLLSKVIGENLESAVVIIAAMLVGGVVMIVVDRLAGPGRVRSVEEMKPWQAVFIGACQILSAVFPGTSRSMSTIASGQVAGLSRAAALEFSFLLSIPIMIVACLYDLLKFVKASPIGLNAHEIGVLAVGFLVSFVVAYAVVVWFLRFVQTRGFFWFGVYRIVFALVLVGIFVKGFGG